MSLGSLHVDTYDLSCPFHEFRTTQSIIRFVQIKGNILKDRKNFTSSPFPNVYVSAPLAVLSLFVHRVGIFAILS